MNTNEQAPVIDISQLTPEQLEALKKQFNQEEKEKNDRIKKERATYKKMVDQSVGACFPMLQTLSEQLSEAKDFVFDTLGALIEMKSELYGRESDQFSHTFSSEDGLVSITIGRNINDGWDDTVEVGIGKVNDFLKTMAKDKNSENLVNTVLRLLSKDSKGNLKASRVLQLKKLSEDVGDPTLIDAIKIIQDAYKPTPSQEYIRCICKDDKGNKIILPLSISEAGFPKKEKDEEVQEGAADEAATN